MFTVKGLERGPEEFGFYPMGGGDTGGLQEGSDLVRFGVGRSLWSSGVKKDKEGEGHQEGGCCVF